MDQKIHRDDYRKRASMRRRQYLLHRLPLILIIILLLALLITFCWMLGQHFLGKDRLSLPSSASTAPSDPINLEPSTRIEISTEPEPTMDSGVEAVLAEADRLAVGYDYDGAIEHLQASAFYGSSSEVDEAIQKYEEIRASLKPCDISQITHVFFHTLVMDEAKAFDGDEDEKGYNQVMTTKDEFLKILDSMYE